MQQLGLVDELSEEVDRPFTDQPQHDYQGTPPADFPAPLSVRKQHLRDQMDAAAPSRASWRHKGRYFHAEDLRYMRFLIPAGSRVLELGCGIGDLLTGLEPSQGVGIDLSPAMIDEARRRHPGMTFLVADAEDKTWQSQLSGPFDYIVLSDTIGALDDVQRTLEQLHSLCNRSTRVVIAYYAHFWSPVLRVAEAVGRKMPTAEQNALSSSDIAAVLALSGFDVVQREWRQLVPARLLGLGRLVNRFLGTLPGIRRLSLRNYVVARSLPKARDAISSATVVIPCRNERGNIESAMQRLPRFCKDIEVIFVEGHSSDGTYEEALRVRDNYFDWDIKVTRQDGIGKADAVFKAFDMARGDVLMILDADLTVPPEQLDKFWNIISSGNGEFALGTRMVYPMDKEAMRFLNLIANWGFSALFTWLLNQRLTDTLCGTKVMRREDYYRLKANRSYFGDFDPFGDFDLIFGAAKMNLKSVEIPIRYAARSYGETQISRFSHGWLLLKMVVFAFWKLKAI
jgi:SAM-dependent methyltransferase